MEQFVLMALITLLKNLPAYSPAYMDLLKLIVGSIVWIGGLMGFMWWKEKNLKPVPNNS